MKWLGRGGIERFDGEYAWLSNMWPAEIEYNGYTWACTEVAYQAMKSDDPAVWEEFSHIKEGRIAKKRGQELVIRPDWAQVKIQIMSEVNWAKYHTHHDLANKLIHTWPKVLVEGNLWHDRYWGVCLRTGKGLNHLGQVLMDIRTHMELFYV